MNKYLKTGWKKRQDAFARQLEQVKELDKAEGKQSLVEQLHQTREKTKM